MIGAERTKKNVAEYLGDFNESIIDTRAEVQIIQILEQLPPQEPKKSILCATKGIFDRFAHFFHI